MSHRIQSRALPLALVAGLAWAGPAAAQALNWFSPGDLVIGTVSCSVDSPTCSSASGGLDTAAPIVLQQYQLGAGGTSVTSAGVLTLPQTANGVNAAISGEYGSASEGILQQSVNGQYLTVMGYGVNAATFNGALLATYGNAALGQSTSLTAAQQTGAPVTTVPRVAALIGANASVDTSTALTGVFNMNNPRSAATVDGSGIYVSGQGVKGDGTGGVFYAARGATTATGINVNTTSPTGADTVNPLTATETRSVQIVNNGAGNTLYVSRDYNPSGKPIDSADIRSFANGAGGLPTSSGGVVATRVTPNANSVGGPNTASIDLTAGLANGVNNARIGSFVYLSPEEYYFANPTTLYIADSGSPKNGSAGAAALGEGGLQKWSLNTGTGFWSLDYDLVSGLNLVNNANANSATPSAPGVTGLFGLTGQIIDGQVELFATSYGLNELSQSFLYEITDTLADTTITEAAGESFTTLVSAPADELIRGVSFSPVPEPASISLFVMGLAGLRLVRTSRRGTFSPPA